tara:strand:- start:210 stop:746 length:537 start_codon:yes stop_codon:yes gene_type:complete
MEHIFDEIQATLNCGIWYPALASALLIPDACGTIEYALSATKPSARYISWYDKWVEPRFHCLITRFDGNIVYRVRNSMMHEVSGFTKGVDGFDRIIFRPDDKGLSLNFYLSVNPAGSQETAFLVSIEQFIDALKRGTDEWLLEVRADGDSRRRDAMDRLLQLRPGGCGSHVTGIPVVA